MSELNINVMDQTQFSSFLQPDNSEVPQLTDKNRVSHAELVRVNTISRIYHELKNEFQFGNSFLKTDTQGFDLQVLEGAVGVLQNFGGLQLEVSVLPIYENIVYFLDAIKIIREHGFYLTGFFVENRDKYMRVIEANCVFINKNHCSTN